MKYLYWYLGVGLPVSAWFVLSIRRSGEEKLLSLRNYQNKDLPVALEILTDILIIALITPIWLVMAVLRLKNKYIEFRSNRDNSSLNDDRQEEFILKISDFQEQKNIDEIEQGEKVIDPLGAVPDLPFGHLNSAWQRFLCQKQPEDTVWTFKAHWTTMWGSKKLMSGYAIKRDDDVGPYFLMVSTNVDAE